MEYSALSTRCAVRPLTEADIPAIYELCRRNPLFYEHCPPFVTEDSIRADMAALPPRMTMKDKHFLGLFDGGELAAILDLITGYPQPEIAFWGFFMVEARLQGRGFGTLLVSELCEGLAKQGFRAVRLGWVNGYAKAEHFWKKNGFRETGASWTTDLYTVTVAQRELR